MSEASSASAAAPETTSSFVATFENYFLPKDIISLIFQNKFEIRYSSTDFHLIFCYYGIAFLIIIPNTVTKTKRTADNCNLFALNFIFENFRSLQENKVEFSKIWKKHSESYPGNLEKDIKNNVQGVRFSFYIDHGISRVEMGPNGRVVYNFESSMQNNKSYKTCMEIPMIFIPDFLNFFKDFLFTD